MLTGRREQIAVWLSQEHLQLTRVHELLLQQGISVSYTTLRRFVRQRRPRQGQQKYGAHGGMAAGRSHLHQVG
jgi:transposase-like protein